MYAEPWLLFPCMQGFPQEVSGTDQELLPFTPYEYDDLVSINLPGDASNLGNLVQTSAISEYDLGGDGDLFKAPQPILEESLFALDPITASISMMSGYGSTIAEETIKVADIESIQNEDLLSEVFNDYKEDILTEPTTGAPVPQASDVKVVAVLTEEDSVGEKQRCFAEGSLQKSVSIGCLSSAVDCPNVSNTETCFLGVHEMDLEAAFGMRRAYSEGDIQTLGINNLVHGNMNIVPSFNLLATIDDVKIEDKIEERRKKLSRYRKKRTTRNYGRKIKYACRKALADSQPRIRGRFAKMEDRHGKAEQYDIANCKSEI